MRRMRTPVQLRVPLRRSRTWLAAIPLLALGALASWLTIDVPVWADVVVAVVVGAWAVHNVRLHGLRRGRTSIVELMLSSDAVVVMRFASGGPAAGHVRSASFVHPLLTTIVWRPDGARWSRSLPIVPDMLDADDFRRLRVLLRYGRSEATAGAPASQA
jgi:toxin CptA